MLMRHRFLGIVPFLLFAADGPGGGGSGGGTLKEQLLSEQAAHADTKASLAQAEQDRDEAKSKLSAATKERDENKTKLDAEVSAHAETKSQFEAEQTAHSALKAEDKTASHKAAQQLAKNGIAPQAKDTPAKLTEDQAGQVALWQQYEVATPLQQAEMRAKHGEKLEAAAEAFEAAKVTR